MKKRILALLLATIMVLSSVLMVACGNPSTEKGTEAGTTDGTVTAEPTGKVIMGNVTDLTGDFRRPTFAAASPSASDLDVYNLTVGYATQEANQEGNMVWNETVVKSHEAVVNEDGSKTFTIEINPGLKYSDGSEVTAKDYVVTTLVFSTEVAGAAGAMSTLAGYTLVGYAEFNAYMGEGSATTEDGVVPNKVFTGVRLLDTYKFSVTIASEHIPYYYDSTYAALEPTPYKLWLGDNVDIADDGQGAYLSDAFYAKNDAGEYTIVAHMQEARYDITKYPFSGPYVISEYDDSTKQATLTANPNFAGNFEGQKPQIKTVVYTKIVSETQNDQLTSGALDILCDLTGGTDVNAGLAIVENGNGKFASTNYMRAGYGKIQFVCDFGPTMFTSVRQAISYLLDKRDFADAFCGGYGDVVYGPYAVSSWMYKMTEDAILDAVNEYNFSVADAKAVLIADGWVYNADGTAYDEAAGGVRYKKLTAEEAAIEANVNYVSVENTDGIEYKTVKVGDDYYMPLVINYISTENNEVSELLKIKLTDSAAVTEVGMVIRQTVGTWESLLSALYHETFVYGMANLATGFTSTIYDQAYSFTIDDALFYAYSNNYLKDPYDLAYSYADNGDKTFEDDKNTENLGLDYLSMAMVYRATTEEQYAYYFQRFVIRWNEMVPEIPLYCNVYYNVYNTKIQGLEGTNALSPYWSFSKALLYCTVAEG